MYMYARLGTASNHIHVKPYGRVLQRKPSLDLLHLPLLFAPLVMIHWQFPLVGGSVQHRPRLQGFKHLHGKAG